MMLLVTSRKGRVSRNAYEQGPEAIENVTSRKGRVSRNENPKDAFTPRACHVPQGACE